MLSDRAERPSSNENASPMTEQVPTCHVHTSSNSYRSRLNCNYQQDSDPYSQAIKKYLNEDSDTYIPSEHILVEKRTELLSSIASAVQRLLKSGTEPNEKTNLVLTTTNEAEKAPEIQKALISDAFFNLCKRVYGAGTKQDLLKKTKRSWVLMKDFLRAMVAASVKHWIFDDEHEFLPVDTVSKTSSSELFIKEIARCRLPLRDSKDRHRH